MSSRSLQSSARRLVRIVAAAAILLGAASGCRMAFSPLESWYDEEAFLEQSTEESAEETEVELEGARDEGDEAEEADEPAEPVTTPAETPAETPDDPVLPEVPEGPETPPAAKVTLAWDANTEPLLAGYRLYYGTRSGEYQTVVETGAATEITIDDLTPGTTYYFAVTAYDEQGRESEHSDEVSYTP